MQKNKRGRPKKQQQIQKNGNATDKSISAKDHKQKTRKSTKPQYDKIMAQIKETYASLNDSRLQKLSNSESKKKNNKLEKVKKKKKTFLRQSKKPPSQDDHVKVESQDLQEHLDQIKSKFNQIFKSFIDNVKEEILKTESELLQISILK